MVSRSCSQGALRFRFSRRTLIRGSLAVGGLALLSACGSGAAATTVSATTGSVTTRSSSSPLTSITTTARTSTATTVRSTVSQESRRPTRSPVSLRFWGLAGPSEPGPTDRQLVAAFNRAHANVQVTLGQVPPVGIVPGGKLIAAIASGTAPDVLFLGRHLIPNFASMRGITALDPYANTRRFHLDDFYPRFTTESTWQGKLFGIPYSTDARALYWNKDLFRSAGLPAEQPPATWRELVSMAAALTKRDASQALTQLGYVPGWGNPPTYLAWYVYLWQLGGHFLTPDHQHAAYDNAIGVRALQTMVDQMQQAGGYTTVQQFAKTASVPTGLDMFSIGKLAMVYNVSGTMTTYDKVKSLDYGIGPLPLPLAGQHVNYSGGFDLTITIGTKHPEQAWQLIDYLVSPGPLLRYNLAGHTIPPRKSVANSAAYLSANRHVKFFVDELNYARWIPVIVGITEIFAVNNTMYEDAITGKESAADAIATSVPQVQAILATYAKKQ